MRRMSAWAVVTAVLLALGIGLLVGRALDDDDTEAASSTAATSTSTSSSSTSTSTSVVEEATAESTTTTIKVVVAAPQTASTTTPTTATTAVGATATTAPQPTNPACGSGTASSTAKLAVTAKGTKPNDQYTYSGPVTVTNNTTKAIEVDSLVLRITSKDGTNEDVPVSGLAGVTIAAGATHDFGFSHTTTHEPKDSGGASVLAFSYGPPNSTVTCGST
jgi:hypothetical protein